jgi:hypothetical protein
VSTYIGVGALTVPLTALDCIGVGALTALDCIGVGALTVPLTALDCIGVGALTALDCIGVGADVRKIHEPSSIVALGL